MLANTKRWLAIAGLFASAGCMAAGARDAATPVVLNVTIDGQNVALKFEITNQAAFGFVRRARTAQEHQTISAALDTLSHSDQWMHLNAEAQCSPSSNSTAANVFETHEGEAAKIVGKPRTTIEVEHVFQCAALDKLASLDVSLIERFPHVKEVIVNLTRPGVHRAEIVTTPRTTVSLRGDGG